MFENGEATDVVTKNHKGSSTEASKSADKAVCLDVARLLAFLVGFAGSLPAATFKQIAEKPERVSSLQRPSEKALRRKVRVSRRQPAQFEIFKGE